MYRRETPYMERARSWYGSGDFCTDRHRGGCPWLTPEVAGRTKAGSGLGKPNCQIWFLLERARQRDAHPIIVSGSTTRGPVICSRDTAPRIAFLCTGSVNSIKTESA